ncbi:MAG: hypothetical protein WCT42_03340 [Candidatus Paceibacterota bacterium]|jgi:Tfp pilus assembly protein PilO
MRFIFPISLIVIAGIIFFVFANPIYGEIKQLKTDISTYKTALDSSTELQKTRDSLIEVYKNIKKEDKERLDHFLPNTINNIGLILEIEKIASLHGMPIKDIKFEAKNLGNQNGTNTEGMVIAENDPSSNLPYGVFPMEFVIEGRYDTFMLFLNDLEHNLRLVDIKSISFTVPNKSNSPLDINNPNIYSYTLKVETYWLK